MVEEGATGFATAGGEQGTAGRPIERGQITIFQELQYTPGSPTAPPLPGPVSVIVTPIILAPVSGPARGPCGLRCDG